MGGISVAAVTATYGSALTAAHFWKGPKVSKRPSPHHSAPRLGSVCPHFGQRGFTGRRRSTSRSKADQKQIKCRSGVHHPVGAGLPAMQAPRNIRHTQLMPSQASQLPQGNASAPETRSATRPPRCVFDLRRTPNPCRITGTPSLGEAPSVGARAFCLLFRSSKVSRRKGGTNSRRDQKNGYVLQ